MQFDTYLYQHFKRIGHSPNDISVEQVEKSTYQDFFSARSKLITRHETELEWITFFTNTFFSLGFNDNIYQDFYVFSLLEFRKCKFNSHG